MKLLMIMLTVMLVISCTLLAESSQGYNVPVYNGTTYMIKFSSINAEKDGSIIIPNNSDNKCIPTGVEWNVYYKYAGSLTYLRLCLNDGSKKPVKVNLIKTSNKPIWYYSYPVLIYVMMQKRSSELNAIHINCATDFYAPYLIQSTPGPL
jgi:hypothetical protein